MKRAKNAGFKLEKQTILLLSFPVIDLSTMSKRDKG